MIKDGWTITADPLPIEFEELHLFADLEAEQTLEAARQGQVIAVEIKSFLSRSAVHDLYLALGQYDVYRAFLEGAWKQHRLYIAVGEAAYLRFFALRSVQF